MGIFSRFSDIVSANVNAILEQAENPEKIVRLMISEMEDTLVEVRASAARNIADRKDLERRLCRARQQVSEWNQRAELAVSKGREDLARAAIVERQKFEEDTEVLESEFDQVDEILGKHDQDISRLEQKLREVRAKEKSLITRHDTAHSTKRVREHLHDHRIDDAFARFDALESRVDRVEAEAEVYELGHVQSLEEEIMDLERDEAVTEELEQLRERVNAA